MSKLLLILFALFSVGVPDLGAQPVPVEKIRDQFFDFDKSKEAALVLYTSLENLDLTKNPVLLAYRGASSAASAASVRGAWKKLEYFNHGKRELEKAISQKPLDAEIRFLRLATQENAPGFLGYSGEKKYDKAIILQTLTGVAANHPNAYLYLRICRFMLAHVDLETAERNAVNQLIVKFNIKK